MGAILIFKCTEGAGVGDYSSRGRGAVHVGRSRFYLEKCPFNRVIITVSKGDVCWLMNSKTREIPVTPPERQSHWCWYSPSIFLASSQTVSRPLSRFDTHLRWPPLTQSLWSGRSCGKIGDCEQSTNFISQTFSDSAVVLATAVSKRCTQDLPVVNTQGSSTGFWLIPGAKKLWN